MEYAVDSQTMYLAQELEKVRKELLVAIEEAESNKRQANHFHCENGALNTKCVNLEGQLAAKDAEIERLKNEQSELIRRFQHENCGQSFMGEPVIESRPVPAKQYEAAVAGRRAFRLQVMEQRKELAAHQLVIQQMREALEGAYDYVEAAINRRIEEYGENFRPHRLEYMREVKTACDQALALQPNQEALEAYVKEAVEKERDSMEVAGKVIDGYEDRIIHWSDGFMPSVGTILYRARKDKQ